MNPATLATARVQVLVVDDSEDQRMLLKRYFERAGCDVVLAGNAEEAVVQYDSAAPDLAIIDLILPGMDGWELTARLKVARPDCVIAITSVLDAKDYPASDAILPKPFTGAQIRRILRDFVPQWQGGDE
jgi:CheY-like chemotaxis protein